jgi:hypothetical protein
MATVALTVREYNDLRIRAAIAAHRATAARNGKSDRCQYLSLTREMVQE